VDDDDRREAVVAALSADQRRLIERGGRVLWPDLDGMDAGQVLAVLRLRRVYSTEIAEFLTAHPDLARDPAVSWVILALLRTGRHHLTRVNVGELLGRSRPIEGTTAR
jgi:hypothetical protein